MADEKESRQREAERLVEAAESSPQIAEAMRAFERFTKAQAVQVQIVPARVGYATGANS